MKYVNAKAVLPYHLVEELQEYIQAGYIYIPAREDRHRAWGEQSGCRRELAERNAGIVDAYRQGVSLEELGDKYYSGKKISREFSFIFIHTHLLLIVIFLKKPLVQIETTTASNSIFYPI